MELVVAKLTVKLACRLFSSQASQMLEGGDVAEEKVRQALLSDFKKIHENLDALRRKELLAAVAFLETGFEVCPKDEKTGKEEFKKARDAAQMAFGVVAEPSDKILATKILVTSTFMEFDDNLETARNLCGKYLERMNTLTGVIQACKVIFTPVKSFSDKVYSVSGNTKRSEILDGVAEINKCVWDYFTNRQIQLPVVPVIRFEPYHIDPVVDLTLNRKPAVIMEVEKNLSGFVSLAMCQSYIFAALQQCLTLQNAIMAINLKTNKISHLLGHEGIVLSLCCEEHYLFSASYDKNIIIWDIESLNPVKTLKGHSGSVRSICLSEFYLFSTSADNSIRIWDILSEFKCVKQFDLPQYGIKLTCSKRKFLFSLCGGGSIQIWDMQKFTLLKTLSSSGLAYNIIANDSRMYVAVKGADGDFVECWNLGSLTSLTKFPVCGANMVKYYNSPYLITVNGDKLQMSSATSGRLIMEKLIISRNGSFIGKKIKYLWMSNYELYVLSEGGNDRNYILRF